MALYFKMLSLSIWLLVTSTAYRPRSQTTQNGYAIGLVDDDPNSFVKDQSDVAQNWDLWKKNGRPMPSSRVKNNWYRLIGFKTFSSDFCWECWFHFNKENRTTLTYSINSLYASGRSYAMFFHFILWSRVKLLLLLKLNLTLEMSICFWHTT